jgi:lysophospholipase L1-like esterase
VNRVVVALAVFSLCFAAHAETAFTDSFEGPSRVQWSTTWGPTGPSDDRAQDGKTSIKETLEDRYGLSVHYTDFDAVPGALYRATAWVYIPTQPKMPKAALAFADAGSWRQVANAATPVADQWVQLKIEYTNRSFTRLRLALLQAGQQAGLGGAVMYWDNVTLERELPEVKVDQGIRINPYVLEGLDVTPLGGMKVRVAPGKMDVDGQTVTVAQETILDIAPPRVVSVRDQELRLTDEVPQGWSKGTALPGCLGRGTTLAGCMVPDSIVLKAARGPQGARFAEGTDWRVDRVWGKVGRIPGGAIEANTPVFADYDYSLLRLDTIEVRSDGQIVLRVGGEHKSVPEPPTVDQHARGLCNLYLPYHCKEITGAEVYPVGPAIPAPLQSAVEAKAALIPNTLAKLNRGDDLTVVFWGDSVTCGGDASSQEKAFPLSFTNWLRAKYPQSHIKYVNAGTGGWNTERKLPLFDQEVMAHKPDLVVIEFVNDMGFDRDRIFKNWGEAVRRIREIGGEVIILTPHFTRPDMMGTTDLRTPETRAAVGFLKESAQENHVGLADASRRWAHLWIEGLPYMTLLYNGINHPDDRGHQLFVEELKLFFP